MSEIKPEETVSSESVFSGNLIDVRKETVRLPNGETATREVVSHPNAVAILAVDEQGRLVMVRQYRKAVDRVLLEVPAGTVDEGETAEETMRREMIEETGYTVGRAQLLAGFYTSPGFSTEYMYLFAAADLQPGEPTEQTDQIEVLHVTPEEALERMRAGEIADAKTMIALLFYDVLMQE